jgi:metal-responsive CopG/Arc/MetJ family transcriptional regulator
MIQAKVSISDDQYMFVNKFKSFGFKNKSSMFRKALELLIAEYKKNQLAKSAQLYAEIYSTDSELKELTESAINDWPE